MRKLCKRMTGVLVCTLFLVMPMLTLADAPLSVVDDVDFSVLSDADNVKIADGTYPATNGSWTMSDGGSAVVGNAVLTDGGKTLKMTKSGSRTQDFQATYTTNMALTEPDTRVRFAYRFNQTEGRRQFIAVSSGKTPAAQPDIEGFDNDIIGGAGNIATFSCDSVMLCINEGKVLYADYNDRKMKEIPGFVMETDQQYYFQIETNAGSQSYNLYIDTQKIGVNSEPLIRDVGLVCPTNRALKKISYWVLGSGAYDVFINELNFSQGGYPLERTVLSEDFETNTNIDATYADNQSSFGWSTYFYRTSSGKQRVMGTGEVVENSGNHALEMRNITANNAQWWTGGLYALYNDRIGMDYDHVSVSFDFISEPLVEDTEIKDFTQSIILTSQPDGVNAAASAEGYTGSGTDAQLYFDSVYLLVKNAKFYYGDQINKTFTEIPGVAYQPNQNYYVKMDVDNNSKTFDLYLSDTELTDASVPVLSGQPMFYPAAEPMTACKLYFMMYEDTSNGYFENGMTVDNILITGKNVTGSERAITVFDDEQRLVENSILPETSYLDLTDLPAGKLVMAASYADNTLVDLAIVEAGKENARIAVPSNCETVKVFTWSDFSTMQPDSGAIVLNRAN